MKDPLMRGVLAVVLATVWISVSEFVRNEFLLKDNWIAHYAALGMTFPDQPKNGAVWGLWSLLFATGLYFLSRRSTLLSTVLVGWLFGFVLMWVVIGNLGVLPAGLLMSAVPLSLLETFMAAWILKRVGGAT